MKRSLIACVLCIFCAVLFPNTASAAGYAQPLEVNITTVIDNAEECPASILARTYRYNVWRTTYLGPTYGGECLAPTIYDAQDFIWAHGHTTTVYFDASYDRNNADILNFQSSGATNLHISLTSIELEDNLKRYTYTDNGWAYPSVQPFNWAEIVDRYQGTASLTLHFRYNPDISEVEDGPEPNPGYSKRIDYLGDGDWNPDTTAAGVNDYRLYLSLDTEAPSEVEKDKDIIFLLDISNSMGDYLGYSTRLDTMKKTVNNAIDILTQNTGNRVSIVSFESHVRTLIAHSSDAMDLKDAVRGLRLPGSNGGGTNYYSGLTQAGTILESLRDPSRETVVFFLTDGEPTACLPAVNAIGYSSQAPIALMYAADAASKFPTVDRFYSVFIGSSTGSASTLQTVTQRIPVRIEKYMVQANSAEQLSNTFSRFLSRVEKSLYDVTIEDQLSEYVDYRGESKVVLITDDGQHLDLASGVDYDLSYNSETRKVAMRLLKSTISSSRYVLSFNVQSNDTALAYFDINQNFPHVGDADTDYLGNTTSSEQPGFYSNENAILSYSFSGGNSSTKVYPKPVVQVVEPDAIPVEIEARKILNGKNLTPGMFTFELVKDTPTGEKVVATATNDENGDIKFDSAYVARVGTFDYRLREKIPDIPEPGMTYDTKEIMVTVTVTHETDGLVISNIQYSDDPIFTNEYQPQPIWVPLNAKKTLVGNHLAAGQFQFRLLTATNIEVETVNNQADGSITFSPLKFTKAGTYTYFIRESVPLPADSHITYDLKTVTAVIEVSDNNGVLEAEVHYTPDNEFVNLFSYSPAEATIQMKKVLTGMQLTTGMFKFELKDLSTGATSTTSNLSNGDILFHQTYDEPGTYQYQVREVIPDEPMKYMTYDDKVITVTVTVSDDGSGDLVASAAYSESPEFYNSYKVHGRIW